MGNITWSNNVRIRKAFAFAVECWSLSDFEAGAHFCAPKTCFRIEDGPEIVRIQELQCQQKSGSTCESPNLWDFVMEQGCSSCHHCQPHQTDDINIHQAMSWPSISGACFVRFLSQHLKWKLTGVLWNDYTDFEDDKAGLALAQCDGNRTSCVGRRPKITSSNMQHWSRSATCTLDRKHKEEPAIIRQNKINSFDLFKHIFSHI